MPRFRGFVALLVLAAAPSVPLRADEPVVALEAPVVVPVPAWVHGVGPPRLALRSDGGYVAVWNDLQSRQAVGRWFGPPPAAGPGESGTFSLSGAGQSSSFMALARGDGDTYLAAWNAYANGPLVTRSIDGRGAPLGPDRIAVDRAGGPFALAKYPGGFVIAWFGNGIFFRLLDAEGAPAGPVRRVAMVLGGFGPDGLSVAADADGEVVVAWSLLGLFPPATISESARGFDASGAPLGRVFELKPATRESGSLGVELVAVGPGRFLAAWSGPQPVTSLPSRVLVRSFDAAGRDLGSPVQVSTDSSPEGFVDQVSLAVASDGRGVVAWSETVSAFAEVLYGRLIDAEGQPLGDRFTVAPEVLDDPAADRPYVNGLDADRDVAGHLVFGWGVGINFGSSSSPVEAEWTSRARRFLEADSMPPPPPEPPPPPPEPPPPPDAPPLTSDALPGFRVWVRLGKGGEGSVLGTSYEPCIAGTLCVVGRVPGRSEVFVRIVGPKPNGRLWPTLVKSSTSEAEVWIEQVDGGLIRYYDLPGAKPGVDEFPGLFDRDGFPPSP